MSHSINQIAEIWWAWMWPMFWQAAAVVAVVWVADLAIRRRVWPQVRYALWLLVLLKLILPPWLAAPSSVTWRLEPLAKEAVRYGFFVEESEPAFAASAAEPGMNVSPLGDIGPIGPPVISDASAGAGAKTVTLNVPGDEPDAIETSGGRAVLLCWKSYAMLVWLLGVAVLTGWLILRFRQLRRRHLVKKGRRELPARLEQLLTEAAKKLRLRQRPEVVLSRDVVSPAVFGFFRPVLLLPAGDIERRSRKELEHVLLHELAHIKRGDLKLHAFYMVLQIVYWFNPLLWLVRRQLQHLRELCCDAAVARILREETTGYRKTILETARRLLAKPVEPGMGLLGLFEDSSRLMVRLKWLEKKTWKYRGLRIATVSIIVAVMTACVLPMAKGSRGQKRRIAQLVKQLQSDNESSWKQAAKELEGIGPPAAEQLAQAFRAGGQADVRAVNVLETMAGDSHVQDVMVRGLSADAHLTNSNVRHCSLIVLAESGNGEHVRRIIPLFQKDIENGSDYSMAGIALGRLGGDEAYRALVEGLSNDIPDQMRWMIADHLAAMRRAEGIPHLKDALKQVDPSHPSAGARIVEAIHRLENKNEGRVETYPSGLHSFTLRGFDSGHPQHGILYGYDLQKAINIHVEKPVPAANPDETMVAGLEALAASSKGDLIFEQLEGVARFQAYHGTLLAPVEVKTEPPHHYWTDAIEKMHQKDLKQLVLDYNNRHAKSVAGRIADFRIYPFSEGDFFAGLLPSGQIAVVKAEKIESNISRVHLSVFYLDPLLALVGTRSEDSVAGADKRRFKAALANDGTAAPKLEFLCWQSEAKSWWQPNGSVVSDEKSVRILKNVRRVGCGDGSHPEYEWVKLLFSHPLFDEGSPVALRMYNDSAEQVKFVSTIAQAGEQASPEVGSRGWITCTVSVGRKEEFPGKCSFELDYAIGSWQTKIQHISKESSGIVSLDDSFLLGDMGTNSEGKAFISYFGNPKKTAHKQHRFVAVTEEGVQIPSGRTTGSNPEVCKYEYRYDVPLKDIQYFQFETRPVKRVRYENVSLRPGVKTEVEIDGFDEKRFDLTYLGRVEQGYTDLGSPRRQKPPTDVSRDLRWVDQESGKILFDIGDIVRFDWDEQIFELTRQSAMDFMARLGSVGVHGHKFILKEEGRLIIYEGTLVNPFSSFSFVGPVIRHSFADDNVKPPLFEIGGGYPRGFTKGDSRFSERLKRALQQADVLSEIDVNNPPSPIERVTHGWFGERNGLRALVEVFPETFRLFRSVRVHVHLTGVDYLNEDHVVDVNATVVSGKGNSKFSTQEIFPFSRVGWRNIYVLEMNPWGPARESTSGTVKPGRADLSIEVVTRKILDESAKEYSHPTDHVRTAPISVNILPGRRLLPEVPNAVMIGFQKGLRESDWAKALTYCSKKIKTKAAECESIEAFFKDVLPMEQIKSLPEFQIRGTRTRSDKVISYQSDVELRSPASKYRLEWNLSLRREDSNWVVGFPTKPLDIWIKHEDLKRRHANEELKFDRERIRKGFRVSLIPLNKDYVIGKPMLFRLEMKNVSSETLGPVNTTSVMVNDPMIVKDPNGNKIPYVDTDYQTAAASEFVEPGEKVVLADNYDVRSQYHITTPGKYTFRFRGFGPNPSDSVEIDIKPGQLSALEGIVESLMPILPEGWKLNRGNMPSSQIAEGERSEAVWVYLIGKTMRKGADRGIGLFLYINADRLNQKGEFLVQTRWGPVYVQSLDAELLWPDYREQIMNALNIQTPQARPEVEVENAEDTASNDTGKSKETELPKEKGKFGTVDFDGYFEDSAAGGELLEQLWNDPKKDLRDTDEILEMVRKGLRRYGGRGNILRWIGNLFIWGKSPQNEKAVELMYHASGSDDRRLYGDAIYFGLSVTKNKTPEILRAMAAVAMKTDDYHNVTGRILWGCRSQKEELIACLDPYLNSDDEAVHKKAQDVKDYFTDSKAFMAKRAEEYKESIREKYGDRLGQFRDELLNGNSQTRLDTLNLLRQKGVMSIVDESFLEAFGACTKDPDPKVRARTARTIGNKFVWGKTQSQEAIEILTELLGDSDRETRYAAVYYGLSTLRNPDKELVGKMLATILDDREINYYGRVIWGLRRNKQACSNILEEWMSQSEQDGQRAIKAYEIYEDVLAERLPGKYAEEFAGQRSNAHEGLVAMCVGTNPLKKEELKRQFLEHVASGKLTEKVLDFYIIEGRGTAAGMFVCENLADRNALRDALIKDHAFHVAGYMHGKIGPTGSGWIDSLKRFRERSELYRVSLPKLDVEAEGEVSRAEVMEVIDSLADELERIAPKYPELSQYRKDAAKKRSQGNWHLSYSHNFTPPRAKRAIRPSDFGEKGFYVSFHCKAMPAPGSPKYAMFAPELTLRNLWLYLWAEVKTGPNPSPGLVDEVQSLLDAHAEKLREIDKRALSGVDQELASRAAEAMNGGDFERAQSLFVEAVKLKPDFAEAWTGVGMACVKAGDYKGAKESYESALSLHQERYRNEPSNANHVLQQIHLLTLLARDAEAKRLLLQARRRHPQDEQLKRFEQAGFSALQDDPQFILPHKDGVYHVRKAPARAIERIRQEQAGSSSAPPTGDSKPSADKVVRDLKAILLCKTKTVKAGERVAVELFLENMSEREIVFCDTREWISHLNVTALVDGKELRGYVRLDERGDIHPMSTNSGPDSMNTEPYNLQYMDSFMESPREVFRVLEPGQKIAYLRMGLEQIRFKEETSKQALQPLQIPGEHIIQVEYQNSATAREFGLDAWTGKVRSNVVTVRVVANPSMYAQGTAVYGAENIPARMLVDAAIAVPVTEVKNLLSKLEKLEKEHLKIIKGKLDSMSKGEKKRFFTHNMAIESGLERKLSTLSEETARSMAAFGEPGVPILLEELRGLSWQSDYSRNCIGAALGHIGRPAVTYLIEALQSGGPNDKTAGARYKDVIISTLGQIGDSRAVEPLLDLFEKNKRAAIRWTSTIATALGLIGDRRAVQPLVSEFDKYLTHAETSGDWDANSPHMRAFAAALGRIGDKRAIPVLKRALNARPQTTKAGKQYLVAEEAAQALRSLGQVVEEITGHVLSPGGRRLAGAEISIDRGNAGIIHSNKRGEFSYYGYCYLLEATHGDWPGHKALASPQGPADSINLTLQRTQKFEERILDEKSEPISGARVTLQVFVGTSASGFATVWSGISDSSGSFVIEETVPGTPYRMVIYAVGYSRAITESFFVHETGISTKNGSDMPRIMRMHPGRGVTFRVLDPAGKPLPNAEIIVGGKDWPYGRGRTDNRGRVAIADIPRPEQLLEQTRARQVHVHVYTEEIRKGQWHQQDNWHEPDDENKVTLQLGASPTSEPDHTNVQVEEILNRLYVAVEKAYADVGLTREDLEKVFSVQMPSQKLWKPYQDAWPAIVKAREAAIAEMASLGPDAVPILLRAKDESDERRGADIFVLAITKIGSPAVPAAIDGLSHTNPVVRARAAAALGRIGDRRAVGPLVRSLSDPRSRVINAAVRSLGQLRDSRAAVPLLELWHRKETGDRRWIASALGNIGDKRAVEPIVAVLEGCVSQAEQTGNWDTNSWAMSVYAGALGQIGDSRAIPVLKKTLRAGPQRTKVDPPKYLVAEAAAAALRKLGVKVEGAGGSYRIIEIAPPVELATVAGRVTDGQTGRGVAGVDVEAIRSAKPVDGVRMMIISDKKEFKSDEA
ncbi:MAG: M56 family metallopeptidase, partial [Planctomycetota bacterium]